MNPLSKIPAGVRLALYVAYALGGVVLTYTRAKGWTGGDELAGWAGLGSVLGLTAASNVDLNSSTPSTTDEGDEPA